jgi:hypothetical protein
MLRIIESARGTAIALKTSLGMLTVSESHKTAAEPAHLFAAKCRLVGPHFASLMRGCGFI